MRKGAKTDASVNAALAAMVGLLLSGCRGSASPLVTPSPASQPATVPTVAPVPVTPAVAPAEPETEACEELAHRCYRPVTFEDLATRKAPPGRVVLTMNPIRHLPCKPCPPGYRCQPCGAIEVFAESAKPVADAPYLALFSGPLPNAAHRLFLCLGEQYWQQVNGYPRDPRVSAIALERAILLSELLQHPEYRLSQMPVLQRSSCREPRIQPRSQPNP